jgi:hypothetical protein
MIGFFLLHIVEDSYYLPQWSQEWVVAPFSKRCGKTKEGERRRRCGLASDKETNKKKKPKSSKKESEPQRMSNVPALHLFGIQSKSFLPGARLLFSSLFALAFISGCISESHIFGSFRFSFFDYFCLGKTDFFSLACMDTWFECHKSKWWIGTGFCFSFLVDSCFSGIYGTEGKGTTSTTPGARYGHSSWIGNGFFWIFGGNSFDDNSTGYGEIPFSLCEKK